MKPRSSSTRAFAGVLAAVFGLVLTAHPVTAEPAPPGPLPRTEAPLAASAAAKVAALSPTLLETAQTPEAAAPAPGQSFFKSGKGVAVLVLLAAGVGYAFYSAYEDRKPVQSPIRGGGL